MMDAGLWVPRRQRPPKVYQPRARRARFGELVQIDGSDHRWFEDRAPACTLLVYVDDATSRLMALHFTASESTFSYFEATRTYIEQHGGEIAHDARHWPPHARAHNREWLRPRRGRTGRAVGAMMLRCRGERSAETAPCVHRRPSRP
jgi:hypothetical protein